VKTSNRLLLWSGVVLDLAGLTLLVKALFEHSLFPQALIVLGLGIMVTALAGSKARSEPPPQ